MGTAQLDDQLVERVGGQLVADSLNCSKQVGLDFRKIDRPVVVVKRVVDDVRRLDEFISRGLLKCPSALIELLSDG